MKEQLHNIAFGRLVSLREKMKSAAIAWRAHLNCANVSHGLDFCRYQDRSVIEVFFEVSRTGGCSACWWVDIEPVGSNWRFNATLRINDGSSENQKWERTAEDLSEEMIFSQLDRLIAEIEAEAARSDWSMLKM